MFEVVPMTLRCVEIEPRHLSLMELEAGDCRYPYGGDVEGEARLGGGFGANPTGGCRAH